MSTTRLLAGSRRSDGLNGALQNVTQLKSLNEVTGTHVKCKQGLSVNGQKGILRIPDHAPILDPYVIETLVDGSHLFHAFVQ